MMMKRISLEPEALKVCEENSVPPLIFQLPPWKGRELLEQAQSSPVYMYPADIDSTTVDTGEWGCIRVFTVRPESGDGNGNVIFYIHGAGWVFGSFHTHEKLVRELAARTKSVVFRNTPVLRKQNIRQPLSSAIMCSAICRSWQNGCLFLLIPRR